MTKDPSIMHEEVEVELVSAKGYQEQISTTGSRMETGQSSNETASSAILFEETKISMISRRGLVMILVVGVALIALMFATHVPLSSKANDPSLLHGEAQAAIHQLIPMGSLETSFCKTKCESSCAVYPSMYGPLCCDWSPGISGGKICAQSIQTDGTCVCGGAGDIPAAPTEAGTPAPKPKPAETHRPSRAKKNDDFWDDKAWSDDFWTGGKGGNGGGGGGWGWKPIEPIKVPENSTPCKRKCDNPCGYSNSKCCEPSPSGSCDITTVNDKCYCGAD